MASQAEKAGKDVPSKVRDWEKYKLKAAKGYCEEMPALSGLGPQQIAELIPKTSFAPTNTMNNEIFSFKINIYFMFLNKFKTIFQVEIKEQSFKIIKIATR